MSYSIRDHDVANIVLEAGALEVSPIIEGLRVLLGGAFYTLAVLSYRDTATLDYSDESRTLAEVLGDLAEGRLSSLRVVPQGGDISWIIIFRPDFGIEMATWWVLSCEYRGREWVNVFHDVAKIDGLGFVVISLEESVDLTADQISATRFPWDHQRLILAAVRERRESGDELVIRRGPVFAS